jgi:hypothetical protein
VRAALAAPLAAPSEPVVFVTAPGERRHEDMRAAFRGYVLARDQGRDVLHFIDDCHRLEDGRYAWRLVRAWIAGSA